MTVGAEGAMTTPNSFKIVGWSETLMFRWKMFALFFVGRDKVFEFHWKTFEIHPTTLEVPRRL